VTLETALIGLIVLFALAVAARRLIAEARGLEGGCPKCPKKDVKLP